MKSGLWVGRVVSTSRSAPRPVCVPRTGRLIQRICPTWNSPFLSGDWYYASPWSLVGLADRVIEIPAGHSVAAAPLHAPAVSFLESPGGNPTGASGYNVINLGGGRNPISLHTVIAFIEKALGKRATIAGKPFHIADIKDGARCAEMAKQTWANISKAGRLLGWQPKVSPEDGFQRSVDWHRQNRSWLKGIKL